MKKVIIDDVQYIPATNKDELTKSLKELVNFKTGDGEGYPITSKELRQNEKAYGKIENDLPFLCESTLYVLMGKEDARTLLSLLHNIGQASGIDIEELYED